MDEHNAATPHRQPELQAETVPPKYHRCYIRGKRDKSVVDITELDDPGAFASYPLNWQDHRYCHPTCGPDDD